MSIQHMALSVDVDRLADRKLMRDYGKMFTQIGATTPAEIRAKCAEARAKGYSVFPPCDNHGPNGHCLGHDDEPAKPPPAPAIASAEERHVLEHATGWLSESPLYRNRYHAGNGHCDMPAIKALRGRGLMLLACSNDAGDSIYCATMDGIRALAALPGQPKRTKKQARELQRLIDANMTEAP